MVKLGTAAAAVTQRRNAAASNAEAPSDFARDLQRLNEQIEELAREATTGGRSREQATRHAYALYQRASLLGDLRALADVESELDAAIEVHGRAPDLCFLKASIDLKLHRLAQARRDLGAATGLSDAPLSRALLADVAFQEGRYAEARREYASLVNDERSWENLARLAWFEWKLGDRTAAESLYEAAVDELTAKEMRSFAWIELQRGEMCIERAHYDAALDHYRRAEKAYSGYWLVDEHMAELHAAQGRCDSALALYETVIERAPRPELMQAMGELLVFMGKADQAQPWLDRALTAYLESARSGDVHYYHHLVDFCSDVREDAAEAVKWAQMDFALRPNHLARAALAWAQLRNGQVDDALAQIEEALASSARDPRLLYRAAIIHQRAGAKSEGDRLMRAAIELNPHPEGFHVHR